MSRFPFPDLATMDIYGLAEHDAMNAWMRTLAEIRGLPQIP